MSTVSNEPTMAAFEGLQSGNPLWVKLANGVLDAYTAYPNKKPVSKDYHVVATIWAPETWSSPIGNPSWPYVVFGFSGYAKDLSHNIVALRGTVTAEEAGYDLYGWGTNIACKLPSSNPTTSYGNVKEDLYNFYTATEVIYTSMAQSFNSAVSQVMAANPKAPLLITAHSLGGALATLGTLDTLVSGNTGNLPPILATFGSLHVGVQSFATAFNSKIPFSLRMANLSDFVPSLVSLEPATKPPKDPYVHVGMECTFTWQKWNDWANHSMQDTYYPTVLNYFDVVKFGPRAYPQ